MFEMKKAQKETKLVLMKFCQLDTINIWLLILFTFCCFCCHFHLSACKYLFFKWYHIYKSKTFSIASNDKGKTVENNIVFRFTTVHQGIWSIQINIALKNVWRKGCSLYKGHFVNVTNPKKYKRHWESLSFLMPIEQWFST